MQKQDGAVLFLISHTCFESISGPTVLFGFKEMSERAYIYIYTHNIYVLTNILLLLYLNTPDVFPERAFLQGLSASDLQSHFGREHVASQRLASPPPESCTAINDDCFQSC